MINLWAFREQPKHWQEMAQISLSPHMKHLIYNKVIPDLDAVRGSPVQKDKINFMPTVIQSFEMWHKGKPSLNEAYILLPRSYLDPSKVKTLPDANSRMCQLSSEAKKFAIAREILYVEGAPITFRFLLGLGLLNIWYPLHLFVFHPKLPPGLSLLTSMCMAAAVCTVYVALMFIANQRLDKAVDQMVASLGQDYKQGGLEYYEKLMKFNKHNQVKNTMLFMNRNEPIDSRKAYFESLCALPS